MTIYEALQQNKMAFGLMETPEYTNEEMQAKAKEIGIAEFDFILGNHSVGWSNLERDDMFRYYRTYRLRADYTEPVEDEYELCKITEAGGALCWIGETQHKGGELLLNTAQNHPKFAGYLYEDGEMRPASVRYFNADGIELFDNMPIKRLQSGDITIKRPYPNGSVVFKK